MKLQTKSTFHYASALHIVTMRGEEPKMAMIARSWLNQRHDDGDSSVEVRVDPGCLYLEHVYGKHGSYVEFHGVQQGLDEPYKGSPCWYQSDHGDALEYNRVETLADLLQGQVTGLITLDDLRKKPSHRGWVALPYDWGCQEATHLVHLDTLQEEKGAGDCAPYIGRDGRVHYNYEQE